MIHTSIHTFENDTHFDTHFCKTIYTFENDTHFDTHFWKRYTLRYTLLKTVHTPYFFLLFGHSKVCVGLDTRSHRRGWGYTVIVPGQSFWVRMGVRVPPLVVVGGQGSVLWIPLSKGFWLFFQLYRNQFQKTLSQTFCFKKQWFFERPYHLDLFRGFCSIAALTGMT